MSEGSYLVFETSFLLSEWRKFAFLAVKNAPSDDSNHTAHVMNINKAMGTMKQFINLTYMTAINMKYNKQIYQIYRKYTKRQALTNSAL